MTTATASTSVLPYPIISQNEAGTSPSMGNLASLVESRKDLGTSGNHPFRQEGFSDMNSIPPFAASSSASSSASASASASSSASIMQKPLSAANGVSFDQSTRYSDAYDSSQLTFLQDAHGSGGESKPYYATYYGKGGSGNSGRWSDKGPGNGLQDAILQKLNYVTHMLEEMQFERTNNVTEELVLYSFLGIFVIFVVDSFTRGSGNSGLGRYTR